MPAFGLVVNNRKEILMIQRAYGKEKGQWSLPGGQQEKGESLKTTAIQETLEETEIRMSADQLYWKSEKFSVETWRGRPLGGHITIQKKECLDAKWFQIDMLPHDDNLAFGPDKRVLGKWAEENVRSRRVYYPRSQMHRAGFGLLVSQRNEVLLVQRRSGVRSGKWSLPGGNANPDKKRRAAAARATWQETSIAFTLERLYFENGHRAQVWLGRADRLHECPSNGRWFPADQLPDDDSLGFALDVRAIEKWASENAGSHRIKYS